MPVTRWTNTSVRKHSALHYGRSVIGQVWRHPSNAGHRSRAVARAVGWQVSKRLTRQPRMLPFGPYQVLCHPDTGSAANVIYFTERFDPVEFDLLDAYLRPGDWVIDAGANVGLYSLWMAALVGRDGRVEAFEAAPYAASRLRENIELNDLQGLVNVHEAAVSDLEGIVDFYVDLDVSNSLAPPGIGGTGRTVSVNAVTLDRALSHRPYALAKFDVEGAEVAALRGWQEHLESGGPPLMLLEVLEGQLRKQGSSAEAVVDLLRSVGYELHRYIPLSRTLEPIAHGARLSGNVVAVRGAVRDRIEQRIRAGKGSAS